MARLDVPSKGAAWKQAARLRILTAREIFLRHPWAPRVFENRANPSLAVLRYYDGLLGIMRDGGFSNDLAHHAMHALGSRALGFAQELFSPNDAGADAQSDAMMETMAAQLPNLTGMMAEIAHDDPDSTLGWCDDQEEFEFGLDILLEGIERRRVAEAAQVAKRPGARPPRARGPGVTPALSSPTPRRRTSARD